MLISFEGLPGSGKSTQARLLVNRLQRDGYRVAYLPDLLSLETDAIGQTLIELFTSSGDPFLRHGDVLIDTFLAAALRAHIVATHIGPALVAHDIVIEDRGAHTMYSYSLATALLHHHMDVPAAIAWLRSFSALTGPVADLALWLCGPVQTAISRWAARDHLTPTGEQRAFLAHVDAAYQELARRDPTMIPIGCGNLDAHQLHTLIYGYVRDRLPAMT